MKVIVETKGARITHETKDKTVHQKTLERYQGKPQFKVKEQ